MKKGKERVNTENIENTEGTESPETNRRKGKKQLGKEREKERRRKN
jgi:hypothetical protein